MDQLLNVWLAELPTILDNIFTGIVNTTSTTIADVMWSHKVVSYSSFKTENNQMASIIGTISTPHITQNN